MKKINKFANIVIFIFIFLLFICNYVSIIAQDENENKKKYFDIGKNFIELVNKGNYNKALLLMNSELKKSFTKNTFLGITDHIEKKYGKSKEYILKSVTLYKEYHLVYITVTYEKAKVLYLVVFDKNFKIAGFYIKNEEFL